MNKRLLLVVVALVALVTLAATSGGSLGKGGKTSSDGRVRVSARATAPTAPTPSGFDSQRVFGTGDDWEPDVAFDPSSNYAYMATTRYGGAKACNRCPDPAIILKVSSDNGVSWGADKYLCACSGRKAQNDPELEVASNGTLYATWLNDYNPGVVFSKSTDRGNTWTAPLSVKGKGLSFSDKPIMAISPNGLDVYIAFNASDSFVVASHNAGASFGTRVKTNTDGNYHFAEGGLVAPNGNVFFSESVEAQSETGPVTLRVIRSTNGGTSWTSHQVDVSQQQPPCNVANCSGDYYASQADIAVDATGKLVVAYTANDVAAANKNLYVKSSTDNGATWSARVLVNTGGDSGFPKIDNGPTAGDFRVAWQDNSAGAFNTYYRSSTNGGATWGTEAKLSDLTSGAPYKSAAGYAFPYGDYFGFAVDTGGLNLAAWGEGASYDGPGGTWYTKG